MIKSSTKPDQWTLSPQMTAAPELWRGCEIVAALWEKVGTFRNLVPGGMVINDDSTQANTGINWVRTASGTGINSTTIATDSGGSSRAIPSDAISFAVLWDNLANDTPEFFVCRDIDKSKTIVECKAGSDLVVELYSDQGFDNGDISGATLDGRTIVSVTFDRGGRMSLYFNGVFQGDRACDWSPDSGGLYYDFNMFGNDVNLEAAPAVWERALTPAEHALIGRDPFAMLRPAGF